MRSKGVSVETDVVVTGAMIRCERHEYLYLVSQGCDYCIKEGRMYPPRRRRL